MHDVAISDQVVLPLKPHLPGLLGPLLALTADVIIKANDLGSDKAPFKVGVDDCGSLGCRGAHPHRPGPHLFDPQP